ncbi:MAG TPA: peptidase T, partial [Bacteroidales bacterium]|nr:peptidase T [Bacteroidales bacterium]
MNITDRFLKYVSFCTTSDEETNMTPSTPGQMEFAEYLKNELQTIGMQDVTLDKNGYLMATLPATVDGKPTIGFIAHMDTSPDASGKHVQPRIIKNYNGEDILLNEEEVIVLETSKYPEILRYKGQDIIVTNGKTLLGADD